MGSEITLQNSRVNSENLRKIEACFLCVSLNEPAASVEGWFNMLTDIILPNLEFEQLCNQVSPLLIVNMIGSVSLEMPDTDNFISITFFSYISLVWVCLCLAHQVCRC